MKFILELFSGLKASWHIGKGLKATRQREHEKALHHYEIAIKYEEKEGRCGSGISPVTLECLARTQARMRNYNEALITAEKSYDLYKKNKSNAKVVTDSIKRIEEFINFIKTGNTEELNKILNI